MNLWDVLQVALVHFVTGGWPLVYEATERTPKVLCVFDADYRVEAIDTNDMFV